MKEIGFNILFVIYTFIALMVLSIAILYPFTIGMKGFESWVGWLVYPSTILTMATQKMAFRFFHSKGIFNV